MSFLTATLPLTTLDAVTADARAAHAAGRLAAPALSAVVMAELEGRPVGDPHTMRVMTAWTAAYRAEVDAEAATILAADAPVESATPVADLRRRKCAALAEAWHARESAARYRRSAATARADGRTLMAEVDDVRAAEWEQTSARITSAWGVPADADPIHY